MILNSTGGGVSVWKISIPDGDYLSQNTHTPVTLTNAREVLPT